MYAYTLPWWHSGKETLCQCRRHRDVGLIPGLRRSSGGRNGNPLQYSCLEKPMDRGAWWLQSSITKSWTRLKQLSTHTQVYIYRICTLYIIYIVY